MTKAGARVVNSFFFMHFISLLHRESRNESDNAMEQQNIEALCPKLDQPEKSKSSE